MATGDMTSRSTPNPSLAGRELLLEVKRYQSHAVKGHSTALPTYNVKLVRQCLDDLQNSVQSLAEEVQAASLGDDTNPPTKPVNMASRPSILYHHACIQRQKRCLLAYHKHRMEGLKTLPPDIASATLTNAAEVDFYTAYSQLRSRYAEAMGPTVDLSLAPPSTHSLQVRCLVDLGQVVLESGRSVTLSKGSVFYLPRADILEFLRDGSMQLLEGEEVDF